MQPHKNVNNEVPIIIPPPPKKCSNIETIKMFQKEIITLFVPEIKLWNFLLTFD